MHTSVTLIKCLTITLDEKEVSYLINILSRVKSDNTNEDEARFYDNIYNHLSDYL